MTDEWFVTHDGKAKHGPYGWAKLKELADRGELQPSNMIFHVGDVKWIPASSVRELFHSSPPYEIPAQLAWQRTIAVISVVATGAVSRGEQG